MKYPHPIRTDIISVIPDSVDSLDCLAVYFNLAFVRNVFSVNEAMNIILNYKWAGYQLVIVWNEWED